MKWVLQVKEEGDLEWSTISTAYDKKSLQQQQMRWAQTEYRTATFRIVPAPF